MVNDHREELMRSLDRSPITRGAIEIRFPRKPSIDLITMVTVPVTGMIKCACVVCVLNAVREEVGFAVSIRDHELRIPFPENSGKSPAP